MDQRAENACGAHGFANGKPVFDYTCDDCMLAGTLDPEDIDRYGNRYSQYEEYMEASYGKQWKTIAQTNCENSQTKPKFAATSSKQKSCENAPTGSSGSKRKTNHTDTCSNLD